MQRKRIGRPSLTEYLERASIGCVVCRLPECEEIADEWRKYRNLPIRQRYGVGTEMLRWLLNVDDPLERERRESALNEATLRAHLRHHVKS